MQFASEFWKSLYQHLKITVKLSTAHHPETDGQTERENQELERYLRSYVNYLQDDWVQWLPLAEFASSNTRSESIGMSSFYANKGVNPRISLNTFRPTSVQQAKDIATEMDEILDFICSQLTVSHDRQARAANLHRIPAPAYKPGDQVWLNTKNIRTKRPCKKRDDKWIRPYTIKKLVGKCACELDLPITLRIHPTFHVSLLRSAATNPLPGQDNLRPGPVLRTDKDDPDTYIVEKVVDSIAARGRRKFKYVIKWLGWPHDQNTEEPPEHLVHAPEAVYEFHERYPEKPRPSKYVHTPPSSQELVY